MLIHSKVKISCWQTKGTDIYTEGKWGVKVVIWLYDSKLATPEFLVLKWNGLVMSSRLIDYERKTEVTFQRKKYMIPEGK